MPAHRRWHAIDDRLQAAQEACDQRGGVAIRLARHKPIIATQTVNNGQIDVPSILGDIMAVDKNNMMQTVVADGFHTKEEIYGAGK